MRLLMYLFYAVAVLSFVAALVKVFLTARRLGWPTIVATCVSAAGLLYLSSLLPGAVALLTPPAVAVTLVVLSAITYTLVGRAAARARNDGEDVDDASFAAVLIPAAPPLLYYALRLYRPGINDLPPLSWDSVSYHLPGFVEFYQQRSLYSLDGPYQTYSLGFDLIANFPGYFFQQHWGVFAAHMFAVLFLFASLQYVTHSLMRIVEAGRTATTVAYATAAAVLVWIFHPAIFGQLGMADLFMGACVLAFLGLTWQLVWSAGTDSDSRRLPELLVLSATALALAIGTKPTALAYVPLTAAALGLLWIAGRPLGARLRVGRTCLWLLAWTTVVVSVGGFFTLRNLFLLGSVVGDRAADWKLSILANVGGANLYVQRDSLVFAATFLTPFAILLLRGSHGRRHTLVRALAILSSLGMVAAFVVTPYVIIPLPDGSVRWELRQSVALFALMTAAFATFLTTPALAVLTRLGVPLARRSASIVVQRETVATWRPSWRRAIACASFAYGVALLSPVWWQPAEGLLGYDRVNGLPPTRIYEWIQRLDRPTRIYAAGLRPYGLFGPRWEHRLFYDLHSTVLMPESAGKARLAAIVTQFRPELVLISVDPHGATEGAEKPLVDWLRAEPTCFRSVFEDDTVSGFAVSPSCYDALKPYVPPGLTARMSA